MANTNECSFCGKEVPGGGCNAQQAQECTNRLEGVRRDDPVAFEEDDRD